MDKKRVAPALLVCFVLIAVGCGRGGNQEPRAADLDSQVAQSVQQTVAAIAVAQTVAAMTGGQGNAGQSPVSASPASTTVLLATPTIADSPPPAAPSEAPAPTDSPAPVAGGCRVLTGVNLRPGPGTAYNPPLGALGANTQLAPTGYSPNGVPGGQWLRVDVPATGQSGWVSAGPQYVSCDVDFASLPVITDLPDGPQPPTAAPTVAPTATRAVAALPPDVDNDAPGGFFPTDHVDGQVIVDPSYLFRMAVRDLNVGDFDGAGIISVEFSISRDGEEVHYRKEENAGFCIFGGGEPACNPWPTDGQGRFLWGNDGPVVESGEYTASINVTAEQFDPDFGDAWNWNFPFTVTLR